MKRIINKLGQGRTYIFGIPTKSIEFFNALCAFSFSLVFLLNSKYLLDLKIYQNFKYIDNPAIWGLMMLASILQFRFLYCSTLKSNIKSAVMLKASSLMWLVFAVLFGAVETHINTGFVIYGSISLITMLAGIERDVINKVEELNGTTYRNS